MARKNTYYTSLRSWELEGFKKNPGSDTELLLLGVATFLWRNHLIGADHLEEVRKEVKFVKQKIAK